jgi:hypothetical protein
MIPAASNEHAKAINKGSLALPDDKRNTYCCLTDCTDAYASFRGIE